MAKVKSKTSIDIKFNVYYKNGRIKRDDYESKVLEKANTLDRLSNEYSVLAKDIITKELGYENNTTKVMAYKNEYENNNFSLKLDMNLDRTLPLDFEVIIDVNLKDNSLKSVEKVLIDAHKAFVGKGCNFVKYSLYSESNDILVMVNEVTPSHIKSGKLLKLLEEGKNNETSEGISVYIKEDEQSH